jgi:hypothetical protein
MAKRVSNQLNRRKFLRATALTGVVATVADPSMEAAEPRGLRLGQLRLIDLSVSLEHDAPGEMVKPRIEYISHCAGAGVSS